MNRFKLIAFNLTVELDVFEQLLNDEAERGWVFVAMIDRYESTKWLVFEREA